MPRYKYYFLPVNYYGQPAGWIEEAYLTEEEAAELRAVNPYVFRSYAAAAAQTI